MRHISWPHQLLHFPIILLTILFSVQLAGASDWPQFMHSSGHAGDAATESLTLPLGLATCVQLDDAVTTAPAVVGGKIYVVDQMGTAYCIDPAANRIVWKSSPDGKNARGGNTSSACVAHERVYYGTTAGRLHVLNARTGNLVRSFDAEWPITGSPTFANESIYFQSVGANVHCLDLDGKERWRWDHYKTYVDPKTNKRAVGFPGSYHDPHYAGGEIAIAGKRLVVNMGWDLYCLEDTGAKPSMKWCNRAPLGKDPGIPMGPAICGDWVYLGHPGTDQFGGFMRVKLADGSFDPKKDFRYSGYPGSVWAVFATPAVRGTTAHVPTHYMGVHAWETEKRRVIWAARTDNTLDQRKFTGALASPALARDHCVFGTIFGDLHVVPLDASGAWPKFKPEPFMFKTPFGRPIASSPAIANGAIYFGCDDGYLYGLAPGGNRKLPTKMADLHTPRSKVEPATGKRYGAPVASMDQGNTNCADDPRLKPPLRLRWAMRPHDLRVQMSADDDSLYFVSEAGTFGAIEQSTGRIRWRQRLNGPIDGWKQLLLDRGILYVTRGSSRLGERKPGEGGASFRAFDAASGKLRWEIPWGALQGTCRTAPVIVGDVVAGITMEGKPMKSIAAAFDRNTGKPLWRIDLPGSAKSLAGGACVLDGVMFFSCGLSWGGGPGSTVAVEPASGKVLWTTEKYHVHGYGRPSARDGLLYLGGQSGAPMYCISAKDATLKWKVDNVSYSHNPSLGQDYFVTRSYGGHGILRHLATGKPIVRNGKTALGGCPDHSCSPVLLTTGRISYAVSSSGLYARDVDTGKILWQSLGFAPRACTTPIAANGRLFFSPNVNNSLYCFEPAR
ncbi:MAG: PQQ-binding-like beta-propeller repeat protein [Planctomycetes bacterium]|nr:PQQ-binding-like beta-propeller repeat protein [Planctomycetota bacterium]